MTVETTATEEGYGPNRFGLKTRPNPDTGHTEVACEHRIHNIMTENGIQKDVWRTQQVWESPEKAAKCIYFPPELRAKLGSVPPNGFGVIKLLIDTKSDPADIAAQLLRIFHVATFTDTGQIYYWKDGVYRSNGETFLSEQMQSAARESGLERIITKHFVAETLAHVQRSTYHDRTEFEANPRMLNLRNGILDLDSLEFQPHDPRILSTIQLPINYVKDAECVKFLKFLTEVLYPEDVPVIQEWFGYCLWRDYHIHKSALFVGGGRNGKSTLLTVLKSMLGTANVASRSLQDLETNRFAKADLFGKLGNIYPDLSDSALSRTDTFKMLCGGDLISGEFKFKGSFKFPNFAKLNFSCNKIPSAHDDTVAFFSRWLLITFPNMFEGSRDNKDLIKELTSEEEISGVFVWSLEGLIRLHANGWNFSYSKSTEQVRQEYVRKSDPVGAFAMDCLTPTSDAQITRDTLYNAFRKYCLKTRLPVIGEDSFIKKLHQQINFSHDRVRREGKRVRVLIGITLQPEECWGQDHEDPDNQQEGQAKLD